MGVMSRGRERAMASQPRAFGIWQAWDAEELTSAVEYEGAQVPVRKDLREAARCALCGERRKSLSPGAVQGRHDGSHTLPEKVVDAVHRIRSDPARLSRSWFDAVIAGGLEVTRYVELVSVTSVMAGLDYCARALGV